VAPKEIELKTTNATLPNNTLPTLNKNTLNVTPTTGLSSSTATAPATGTKPLRLSLGNEEKTDKKLLQQFIKMRDDQNTSDPNALKNNNISFEEKK
jgi:hypothetical protein